MAAYNETLFQNWNQNLQNLASLSTQLSSRLLQSSADTMKQWADIYRTNLQGLSKATSLSDLNQQATQYWSELKDCLIKQSKETVSAYTEAATHATEQYKNMMCQAQNTTASCASTKSSNKQS